MSGATWPAHYEIRVDGLLDGRWSAWFEGLQLDSQGGETLLSRTLADRSALHGILDKVHDLCLCIITVLRLPPEHTEAEPR